MATAAIKEKFSGVYQIQSRAKPEKIYIGSGKYAYGRKCDHMYLLKKGTHHSKKLQHHVNKYGLDDIIFSLIEEFNFISKNHLLAREQYYIDLIHPWFNINLTAGSRLGVKVTKESRKKMSDAHKGKKQSAECIKKRSLAMMGHPYYNKGMAPWNKGLTAETDDRVRLYTEKGKKTLKGKIPWNKGVNYEELNKKTGSNYKPWNKGRRGVFTEESLAKMRKPKKKKKR